MNYINNYKTYSVSNILIFISFIVTSIVISSPEYYVYWINSYFLSQWQMNIFIFQMIIWIFIHWWILHLLSNSIFVYLFWNVVENILWFKKYLFFIITSVIFTAISLIVFSKWNTVWISWVAMSLLWFYTIVLYLKSNQDYKWWITAIIINIAVWFTPWISLIWHTSWVIIWVLFWLIYMNKKLLKNIF